MAEMTLEDIYRAAARLTPEEQEALIARLRAARKQAGRSILDDIPVIDVGPWPEGLSLRREDMYGNGE